MATKNLNDPYEEYGLSQDNKDHQKLVSRYNYYQEQICNLDNQLKRERKIEAAKKLLGDLTNTENNRKQIERYEGLRLINTYELNLTKFALTIAGLEAARDKLAQEIDVSREVDTTKSFIDGRQKHINIRIQSLRELGLSDEEIKDHKFDNLTQEKQVQANKIVNAIKELEADIQRFEQHINKIKTQSDNASQKVSDLNKQIAETKSAQEYTFAEYKLNTCYNSMCKMKIEAERLYTTMIEAHLKIDQTSTNQIWSNLPSYKKSQDHTQNHQDAKDKYEKHITYAKEIYQDLLKYAEAYKSIVTQSDTTGQSAILLSEMDKILTECDPQAWNADLENAHTNIKREQTSTNNEVEYEQSDAIDDPNNNDNEIKYNR